MTITQQQVADLREGDTVQIEGWYDLTVLGRLSTAPTNRSLWLGQYTLIRDDDGNPADWCRTPEAHLTVVSRASRPLYVNHPRTEPVPGDVADYSTGHLNGIGPWFAHRRRDGGDLFWMSPSGPVAGDMPFPMRLLVDGEAGRCVP